MARSSTHNISSSLALNLSAAIILWILLTLVGVMLFLVWEARLSAEQQVNLEGEVVEPLQRAPACSHFLKMTTRPFAPGCSPWSIDCQMSPSVSSTACCRVP